MQKGQIALGVGTLILGIALYFGGRTVAKEDTIAVATAESFSFEQYEQQKTASLLAAEKEQIGLLSQQIKATTEQDTAKRKQFLVQVADFWKNLGNPALEAYYLYQTAEIAGTKMAFSDAGDAFVNAYKNGADSVISNNLITFALRSYENALEKGGDDVDIKLKLAEVYVQGSQEPMKGITMLRQLADSLPANVNVQLALGRLSIQSGQYDKAKERLQKVLQLEPQNTEALYFLAITEAQLGHTEEAIRLFEMCKLIVGNKDFNKEIDEIVENLKSKKE